MKIGRRSSMNDHDDTLLSPLPTRVAPNSALGCLDQVPLDPSEDIQDKRRINPKFLIGTAVAIGVIIGGVAGVHEYQLRRMAFLFLERSEKARVEGELEESALYLRQYLALAPGDSAAEVDLAMALHDLSKSPRQLLNVYVLFEQILRAEPNQSDVRQRLIDMALKFGRHRDAASHLRYLLRTDPDNADMQANLAKCHIREGNYTQAEIALRAAIHAEPRRFELYERLAGLLSDKRDLSDEAQAVLNKMVESNSRKGLAWLSRANFHYANGRFKAAILDAHNAYFWSPDDVGVLAFVGVLLANDSEKVHSRDYFDPLEVQRKLDQAMRDDSKNTELIGVLVQLEIRAGRLDLAKERLRTGLKQNPKDRALRWMLVDLLVREQDFTAAQDELAVYKDVIASDELVDYLAARMDMSAGRWMDASDKLNRVISQVRGSARIEANLYLHLAECYRHLGHNNHELDAHRRATEANSLSGKARMGLADSYAKVGRFDSALELYRQLGDGPDVQLAIARLLLRRNQQNPDTEQNWEEIHGAIDIAAKTAKRAAPVQVAKASVLAAQGKIDDAIQLLTLARKRSPADLELWLALIDLRSRQGNSKEVGRLLTDATEQFPNQVEFLLAKIGIWTRQRRDDLPALIAEVLENRAKFSSQDQVSLLIGVAQAYQALDESDRAEDIWKQLIEMQPDNVSAWNQLAELGIATGQHETFREAVTQLRRIEGPNGPYWKLYESRWLVRLAENGDRVGLPTARRLLNEISPLLLTAQVPLAQGRLAEINGEPDEAVVHYRAAMERGAVTSQVVMRVVTLLYRRGKYLKAQQILDMLQSKHHLQFTGQLGRLATEIAVQTNNRDSALNLLQQVVSSESTNPRDHLWSARILWSFGKYVDAENRFRRAVELQPTLPEAWVGLIYFLVRTDRIDAARKATASAAKTLPAKSRALTMAQCYEIIGDMSQVEQEIQKAIERSPQDADVLTAVAEHYLSRGDLARAEEFLRKIIDSDTKAGEPQIAWARRGIAVVALVRRGYLGYLEGMTLVEQNLSKAGGNSADDLRVKAKLLASRTDLRSRRKAIAVLEQLSARRAATPTDKFLQVRLSLRVNSWRKSRDLVVSLAAENDRNPTFLSYCIRAMFTNGETGSVSRHLLGTLHRLRPEDLSTHELQLRLLVIDGNFDEAIAFVRKKTPTTAETSAAVLGSFADLLSQIAHKMETGGRREESEQLAAEAEKLYRRIVAANPKLTWKLARFLAGRLDVNQSMQLCGQEWSTHPSAQLALVSVELLRLGKFDRERYRRVRSWLTQAIADNPASGEYQFQLGNACNLAGEYQLALRHYRRAMELAPRSILVRNETAALLAAQGADLDNAFTVIDDAINNLAGPVPFMLDTRATVLLAMGRTKEAIRDLERAVADEPTPAKFFHLAVAHKRLDRRSVARLVFQKGVAIGLDARSVHPLEKDRFEKLQAQLRNP